jgi:hypothetical protein
VEVVTVPLVEMVSVTGQVVTVSYVTTVVVTSPVMAGAVLEAGVAGVVMAGVEELDSTGELPVGVLSGEVSEGAVSEGVSESVSDGAVSVAVSEGVSESVSDGPVSVAVSEGVSESVSDGPVSVAVSVAVSEGVTSGVGLPELEPAATEEGRETEAVSVAVTGHTVVETAMVEVMTLIELAGQLVTVGAQLVMVISLVVYTVEVVHWTGVVTGTGVVMPAEDDVGITSDEEGIGVGTTGVDDSWLAGVDDDSGLTPVSVGTAAVRVEVVLPGEQSKSMLWTPMSQSSSSDPSGCSKLTEVAPPHWSLLTWVPSGEQEATLRQVDPSGMP